MPPNAPDASKATNLRRLADAGFPVPPFAVVPDSVFQALITSLDVPVTETAVRNAPLPPDIVATIRSTLASLPDPVGSVAVRSSMAGEDSARHSFAGQLETVLEVQGEAAVVSAVQHVWASAFGARATAYRAQHGLAGDGVAMEVILQAMVPAEVAGVLFTVDVDRRDPRWMVVSAAPGLGEALVRGDVAGEVWRIARESGAVEGESVLLAPEQLAALVDVGKRVEALFGGQQDIEFAFAGGRLWLLQARPITTPVPTERMLWDNSNITESYAGLTSPLTFSVIRRAYASVYRQFLTLMGAPNVDEALVSNLLGFYRGQVYYQLDNWYAALALLPAFSQNRRFMEQMMGVKQTAGADAAVERFGSWHLAAWIVRVMRLHRRSERDVDAFMANVEAILADYRVRDLEAASPQVLGAAYRDLEQRVLGQWRAPIVTDFFAMVFFGLARRLAAQWGVGDAVLAGGLLAAGGDIESVAPVREVQALAEPVRTDPAIATVVGALADPASYAAARGTLDTSPHLAAFAQAWDDYLTRYGDRCVNELKLETPTFRDDPTRLARLVVAAAAAPPIVFSSLDTPFEANADLLATLSGWQRWVMRWVLARARRHMRNRENMRFTRTRVFGLLRRIFRAAGADLAAHGVLATADDVFFLRADEVWDYVGGTATTLNLSGLVTLRRAEYVTFADDHLPDRFETYGIPYLDTPRDLLAVTTIPSDGTLRGVGCRFGRVTATARVLTTTDGVTDLGGAILVAERTDPGWVFLFPSAAGILVERGSPLSHSVIVARELGIPIIVNIPSLTRHVQTGDVIRMDGATGSVAVVSPLPT